MLITMAMGLKRQENAEHNDVGRREEVVMPLTMAAAGEPNMIKKIVGREETRRFLEKLGFVPGGTVSVISKNCGSLIVNVKDSRVAIGSDMANRIMIERRRKEDREDENIEGYQGR